MSVVFFMKAVPVGVREEHKIISLMAKSDEDNTSLTTVRHMAQRVTDGACSKCDNLNVIPGAYIMEGEDPLQ